ncbi:hypothetical protein [Agrococcus casei]|uniref:hypothetical protein n=1 Tax=Agrococcus casei TaxID=343512 RepID=UPI003F90F8E7
MHARRPDDQSDSAAVSPAQARTLLGSIPKRPRRRLRASDHFLAAATIAQSFAAGILAVSGQAWWAIIPGIGALMVAHHWVSMRQGRVNEPRMRAAFWVNVVFTVWLTIPIWRGIVHGETIPFPAAFLFASLAPAVWLIFYAVLLRRR